MKKAMKSLTKRALALFLVVAMAVAYLPMTGIVLKTNAAEVSLSITSSEVYLVPGRYINVLYSSSITDRATGTARIWAADIPQLIADGDLVLSGGMTQEDFLNGLVSIRIADGANIQIDYTQRPANTPFPIGASFTLKAGTKIPYPNTSSGTSYAVLDAEYVFTVTHANVEPTSEQNWYNRFAVSKVITTTFGMSTGVWGSGITNAGTNVAMDAPNVSGWDSARYVRLDNDVNYVDYIDFAGIDIRTLETKYSAKLQYILDGSNKVLQITWGSLRDVLKTGDMIVLKKGFPITYTASGVSYKALLDADYVMMVTGSNSDNTLVFTTAKYDSTVNQYALNTGTKGYINDTQMNLSFKYTGTTETFTAPYTDIFNNKLTEDYIEFSSCTLEQVRATGATMNYIQAATCWQFTYPAALKEILKTGDTITFKKGMPLLLKDNSSSGVYHSATLANTYQCIITDTGMEIKQLGEFSLTGASYQLYTEGATQYVRLQYTTGQFTDFPNGEKDLTAADASLYDYINVNGVTGSALKDAGYYLKLYKPNNTFFRLYKSTADFPAATGDTVVLKKGMPIDYTASNVYYRYVLDKDYGFKYDGTNYTYDASITFPESETGKSYGLTTKLGSASGGNENGVPYWDSAITGSNVTFTSYDWGVVSAADLASYVDFSHCTNPETVKAGITVKMILASDATKIIRVLLTADAQAALRNGDYITLKKGMPILTANNKLATALDQDYEINIVNTNPVKLNFTVPAGDFALIGGNASLPTEGGKYYAVQSYDAAYFADMAAGREVVDFNEIQNHILVTGMDAAALSAAGWDIQMLHSEARQFRLRFTNPPTGEDVAIVLKKGLPVTYTTTDGIYKTAHLDKAYGYYYSTTGLTYDSTMTTLPVVITPEDHTPSLDGYPGSQHDYFTYLYNTSFPGTTKPDGIGFSFSSGVSYGDGMAKIEFSGNSGYVFYNGTAIAGHTYVMSYWVYVTKVSGGLSLSPFSNNGVGGPTPTGWNNYLESAGSPIINISAPLTSVSDGWQQIIITWTAQSDGTFQIGLLRNPNGQGSGTVYLDDVMCFDITKPAIIERDDQNFGIEIGKWHGTGNVEGVGLHTNLPLTSTSLEGIYMGTDANGNAKTYWEALINYELKEVSDCIDFFGLTPEQMKASGVQLKLIKNTATDDTVLQIIWGNSLELIKNNTSLVLKAGLQVTYTYDSDTYGPKLLNDYTLISYVGRDQKSILMIAVKTDNATVTDCDFDGNGNQDDQDINLSRLYLCEAFVNGNLQVDVNGDGVTDAIDLILVIKGLDTGDMTKHNMYNTILAANEMADKVNIGYTDASNSAYAMSNMNMTLTHNMGSKATIASLVNKTGGGNFLEGATFTPYAVFNGNKVTETNYSGTHPARMNTYIMGQYYQSTGILDNDWRNGDDILWVEKGYEIYAGKQHGFFRVVAGGTGTEAINITRYGFELKIPHSNINSWVALTGNDTAAQEYWTGTGENNVKYVAIDTKSAGVFGFIFAGDCLVDCTDEEDGDYLIIRQYVNATNLAIGDALEVGHRLYTERADGQVGSAGDIHSFDGIHKAYIVESTPLTAENFVVDTHVDDAEFLGYDPTTGLYNFKIDGYEFGEAVADPDKKFSAGITLKDSTVERVVYICVTTRNPLEGATVLDKNDVQLPIALQVNKNFGHENEEIIYYPETTESYPGENLGYVRGECYMPLYVGKNTTQTFTIVQVMENWGNFRLKQVSSIEYYMPYYHLSTGVTETTCIAPFGTAYRDLSRDGGEKDPSLYSYNLAWLLPDFRGASNSGQWNNGTPSTVQKNSSGTVFGPTADKGVTLDHFTGDEILSSGLTYADIIMSYTDAKDGRYSYTMRHMEMPQTDESRTYYTLEFTILKDCTLSNDDFNIMAIGSRGGTYDNHDHDYTKAAYLGSDGQAHELTVSQPTWSGGTGFLGNWGNWSVPDDTYALSAGSSYFTLYGLPNAEQENANVGIIVKDYTITQNGAASNVGLAFRNTWIQPTAWQNSAEPKKSDANFINYGALVLNGTQSFKAGDTIKLNLILLSYGETSQMHYDNVKKVYQDTVVNPVKLSATVGTVVEDGTIVGQNGLKGYIPTIMAEDNLAEFTISGGTSGSGAVTNYTVRIKGVDRLQQPAIYEKINGVWQRYRYTSESRYDGYTVQYEDDGTITYSFVVSVTDGVARTFGFSAVEKISRPTLNITGEDLNTYAPISVTTTQNKDGSLTMTGTKTEGYVYGKGLNLYAPDSQRVTLRVKLDTASVNQITLGIFGEYIKDGIKYSGTDFGTAQGGKIIYVASFGEKDSEGYYTLTIDLTKNEAGFEWIKIKGLRVGFVGADGQTNTITIDRINVVE